VDLSSGYQDEVIRWELNGCGDGIYNNTQYSFEQCDKAAQPPNYPVDNYKYPAADNWLRKEVFYDTATRDYYTCSDICLRQSVDLCGDGYESNGPYDQWDTGVYPTKDDREECDDGNIDPGDGCDENCRIEYHYECMDDPGNDLWGIGSCRPKCGNGIVESYVVDDAGTIFVEQCDLTQTWMDNTGDTYAWPCDTTCQKQGCDVGVDFHLWKCETTGTGRQTYSVCTFLCGNKYLDTDVFEPCDYLDRPWTGMTKDGYVDLVGGWDDDPATNSALNAGCTKTCLIRSGFVCPADNGTPNPDLPDPDNDLFCSDRCHDGEYDGPYPEIGR